MLYVPIPFIGSAIYLLSGDYESSTLHGRLDGTLRSPSFSWPMPNGAEHAHKAVVLDQITIDAALELRQRITITQHGQTGEPLALAMGLPDNQGKLKHLYIGIWLGNVQLFYKLAWKCDIK